MLMIKFAGLSKYNPGLLFSLLSQCYSKDLNIRFRKDFKGFDKEAFEHTDTIGACVFITSINKQVIGFGSYDPRQRPEIGIIGHNCILPNYQNKGYGKLQIIEILRIFNAERIKKAKVTTGDISFFIPAQKMYQSCGFKEVSRTQDEKGTGFGVIEYEYYLKDIT